MTNPDLALIGAGYWGKNLARNFHALGALHTLCDANQATLESYDADQYAGVRFVNSFESLLQDDSITKVAIATPAATHFPLAKAAMEAGKDVYVEKPLCLDIAEAAALVELSKQLDRILMVGHLLQYHPYVEKLTQLVHAGELGRLYYITSNRLNLGKIRQEENALWSFAPHDISVILGLAGSLPKAVSCSGESYLTNGVADTTLTQMRFDGGLRAHVYVSWLNPFKEQKLTVVGSDGMAVFDDTKPWEEKLVIYRDHLKWTEGNLPTVQKGAGEPVSVAQSEPLRSECQHFLTACSKRSSPRTDGAEGLRVLKVLHTAQQSLDAAGQEQPVETENRSEKNFFAHPTAVIDAGAKVGHGTKIWHFSHVSDGAVIGEGCNLGQNVYIAPGVTIGRNVKIQNNVSVYTGTVIEDDVFLGPSCVLTNVINPRSEVNRKSEYKPTIIKRGATIGANATVVCNLTIGQYAFIAAGAVVTTDVAEHELVIGVPARHSGWISRHGHKLQFDQDSRATCLGSGDTYLLSTESMGEFVLLEEYQDTEK